MTGAGTTTVAWTREDDFMSLPSDPTYVHAGRNVEVQDMTLSNALERSRVATDNEAIESIAQDLSGALSLSYDLVHPWPLTDAFVDEPTDNNGTLEWSMGSGQMPTSRWYIGVDVGSATVERELKGAATTQLQIQISQGSPVSVTQTIVYGDEEKNTSITPGTIEGKSESPYVFHGADFDLDGTTQKKMQQGTLEITNGGALDRGWARKAVDAVAGEANYSLTASKIADASTDDNVALAYGATDSPTTDGDISAVDAEIPITRADGDEIRFPLTGVRPNTYGWDNIPPTGETRVQEAIEFHVNRVEAEADVSMTDPF